MEVSERPCEKVERRSAVETKYGSDFKSKCRKEVRERNPKSIGALKIGENGPKTEQRVGERYTQNGVALPRRFEGQWSTRSTVKGGSISIRERYTKTSVALPRA